MFEQEIRLAMAAAAAQMADTINKNLRDNYLTAASNWADNKARGAAGPPPVVPKAITFSHNLEANSIELVVTDTPVSNVKPEDFLPTYATDKGAVGGPVGGPIPDKPGLFSLASNANVYAGQVYTAPGGGVYVVQQPTPFQKYWLKVA